MTFTADKNNALKKDDKSSKGSIDPKIEELCNKINTLDDYYTTSSCAGRIVLLKIPESRKKNEFEWLYTTHQEATLEDIKKALQRLPEDSVWFRFEPFILHVNARTTEHAAKLLKLVQDLGIKRSGIISLGNKIIIEMIGTEHTAAIISDQGRLLVDDNYLKTIIDDANEKMKRNWENIDRILGEMNNL